MIEQLNRTINLGPLVCHNPTIYKLGVHSVFNLHEGPCGSYHMVSEISQKVARVSGMYRA